MKDLGFKQTTPTVIYNDNQATIHWCDGRENFKSTRHIELRFHYTRKLIEEKVIKVIYQHTTILTADILTKALPAKHFRMLRSLLMDGMECEVEEE